MADTAVATPGGIVAAASASPTKAKTAAAKQAKPKKAKVLNSHPKYVEMTVAAISSLNERTGSSRQAILKYIMGHYSLGKDPKIVNTHLKLALKRGVATGVLKHAKGQGASGSFRVMSDKKSAGVVEKKASPMVAAKSKAKKPPTAKKTAAVAKKSKSPKKAKAVAKSSPKKASPAKPKKNEKIWVQKKEKIWVKTKAAKKSPSDKKKKKKVTKAVATPKAAAPAAKKSRATKKPEKKIVKAKAATKRKSPKKGARK